jgi:hypothetical protein
MLRRGGVASLGCRVVGANGLWLQWWQADDKVSTTAAREAALADPIYYDECDFQQL